MIVPLTTTEYNIPVLADMAKRGLNITLGTEDASLAKPMILLAQAFKCNCEKTNARATLQEAGSLLRHSFFAFILIEPHTTLLDLIMESDLAINHVETNNPDYLAAIVSGNLAAWRNAIINGMLDCGSHDLRSLMNEFLAWFKARGFGPLFSDYRERKHADGTLLLELKK